MKKNERLRKRFGSVVTAGLVASALVAAPATMLVGAVPAMAEGEPAKINDYDLQPAVVNYGNGWIKINSLEELSNLDPGDGNEALIYLNEDSKNRIEPLEIGFAPSAKNVHVDFYLRGHEISNTYDGDDLWHANAIVANCNLTIEDFPDSEGKYWTGKTEDVGRVHSENGYAVITDKDQVTIKGGFYSGINWQPLFGHITIDRGAFLSDPRESVPGSAVGRNIATSQTASDPKTYWLVGEYADNAWSSKLPSKLTSGNVVTIKQMQDLQYPNISLFNVKELINGVNYPLTITNGKCGDVEVPPGTSLTLNPGGHLSKVVALNDANTTKVEIADQTWNDGRPITPHATVTIGDKTLSPSTDYYLDNFEDNTQVGTAKVKVVGKGEYAGASLDATFNIVEPVATPEEDLETATANVGVLLNDMDQRRYTDESVQAVQAALDEANQVLADFNDGKATKEQVESALAKLNDAYGKLSYKPGITMFRLYNPYTGEHLYTASAAERDNLVILGWNDEGVGWTAPASSNTAVYRLYNPYTSDHHYTTSAAERDNLVQLGWNAEGIGWFSDDAQGVPLYRQFNPYAQIGTHNYTTSKAENDHLASIGWNAEGIAWYGM